jgi:hypothetical protein
MTYYTAAVIVAIASADGPHALTKTKLDRTTIFQEKILFIFSAPFYNQIV